MASEQTDVRFVNGGIHSEFQHTWAKGHGLSFLYSD
jgi:hypothetical protein